MNELILKEMNGEKVIYLYHPEGKEAFGEIVYLFSDNQAHVERKADGDETGYYAHKATRKVENCIKKNYLPIKIINAWY